MIHFDWYVYFMPIANGMFGCFVIINKQLLLLLLLECWLFIKNDGKKISFINGFVYLTQDFSFSSFRSFKYIMENACTQKYFESMKCIIHLWRGERQNETENKMSKLKIQTKIQMYFESNRTRHNTIHSTIFSSAFRLISICKMSFQ